MSVLHPQSGRGSMLGTVARWWRHKARSALCALESCVPDQAERMAQGIGTPASKRRLLLGHDPDEAELLRRRMATLHLDLAGR